jgi:hypothetical protein
VRHPIWDDSAFHSRSNSPLVLCHSEAGHIQRKKKLILPEEVYPSTGFLALKMLMLSTVSRIEDADAIYRPSPKLGRLGVSQLQQFTFGYVSFRSWAYSEEEEAGSAGRSTYVQPYRLAPNLLS